METKEGSFELRLKKVEVKVVEVERSVEASVEKSIEMSQDRSAL